MDYWWWEWGLVGPWRRRCGRDVACRTSGWQRTWLGSVAGMRVAVAKLVHGDAYHWRLLLRLLMRRHAAAVWSAFRGERCGGRVVVCAWMSGVAVMRGRY